MAQQERKDRKQTEENLQTTRTRNDLVWREPFATFWNDPFSFLQRDFWPSHRESWIGRAGAQGRSLWSPQIESFQRGDQFVVRADLPGLKKEDVNIEVSDDSVIIQGERREEHEDDREGYYRSERTYGSFHRVVPLPEGAITDSAKAQFNNGVLEIVLQAPPKEVSRGRRLEISEPLEAGRSANKNQQR
jgi:HSP20 family protein